MSRSKDKNEYEHLKGIIRNLKSENRQLKKQLSRASKHLNRLNDLEEIVKDEGIIPVIEEVNKCPECGGSLKRTPIADIRIITSCTVCKYRKTEKKK